MYMRFDCSNGLIGQFGYLRIAEIFKIVERYRNTVAFSKCSQVHLKFTAPLVPVCLLVRPERWIFYLEQWAVLRDIERDGWMLRLALAVAENIQGDRIEPLPKPQCTYFEYRIALQCVIGTKKSLLHDVFSILWTTFKA